MGVFFEDWGIIIIIKLNGIKCDYVYMCLFLEKWFDFFKFLLKDV